MIAKTYALLFADIRGDTDLACKQWHRELQSSLPLETWENIHVGTFLCSRNVNIQEHGYKLKSRWYKTPVVLHKCFPSVSHKCWRCGPHNEDLVHGWWSCSAIESYWRPVLSSICKLTDTGLDFSPTLYLLLYPGDYLKIFINAYQCI